jgi:D-3-phosphoglycerate dehydrogenase
VPLTEATRGLVNAKRIALMPEGATVLNFARAAIVDEPAVVAALRTEQLCAYVCDFPSAVTRGVPGVVALPHLGASTSEAEENCAMMVADTLRDFLEHGNVRHSVNFPEAALPRVPATARIAIANSNVPNMVGQISTQLAEAGLNIADLLNKSKGELAYTLIDIDGKVPAGLVEKIGSIQGVLSARAVP